VLGWTKSLDPAPQVEILPGAGHFFHGRLTVLRSLVGDWLGRQSNSAA
jgi:alpha/beta superfamily hydrolase